MRLGGGLWFHASLASFAAVVVTASVVGWDAFFIADGETFLGVARDLSARQLESGDDAYRYGRMLFPLLGWLLALGQHAWLPVSLMVVNCLAVGAAVGCAGRLAARAGRHHPRAGLVVLVAPALLLCLVIAWAEALLIALLLGAAVLATERRHVAATVLLATAALTKETALVALLPLTLVAIRQSPRQWRLVRLYCLSPLPLLGWWTWAWFRIGELPPLASTPSRSGAIGLPGAGIVELLARDVSLRHLGAVAIVIAVAAVALRCWRTQPDSLLAGLAGTFGAFSLLLGPNTLAYPLELVRVVSPAIAFLVVVLVPDREPRVEPTGPGVWDGRCQATNRSTSSQNRWWRRSAPPSTRRGTRSKRPEGRSPTPTG